jgi:hypothetical protein
VNETLRPAEQDEWTDADGTVWERSHPKWLTESDAARLQLRDSTLVATERTDGPTELTWLSPAERRTFWKQKVAGHLDEANGADVPHNQDGITFRASLWTEPGGRRLILISRWR